MTHFEVIKKMNIREMTGLFYTMLLPWTKAFSEEEKKAVWLEIETFLNSEAGGQEK